VDFEIIKGDLKEKDVQSGTVKRGSATCPVCGYTTPVVRVRQQAKGKGLPVRMVAVVTAKQGQSGKSYRLPTERDLKVVELAERELEKRKKEYKGELSLLPDEVMTGKCCDQLPSYGMPKFGDLFTPRQSLALMTFVNVIKNAKSKIEKETDDSNLAKSIITCLGINLNRIAVYNTVLGTWHITRQIATNCFGRQALCMVWDFTETNPFGPSFSWDVHLKWVYRVIQQAEKDRIKSEATVQNASATKQPLPDKIVSAVVTDPPYYDAICYADLSDFFYVWFKRTIGDIYPDLFRNILTIKNDEIVVSPYFPNKDKKFFESKMTSALLESNRTLSENGISVVVFAHKSTEGWESIVKSMIDAKFYVTASWPIETEMPNRVRAAGTASLQSSIHIVCRPRPQDAGVGDWREVLSQLQPKIHEWMPRLSKEGIVGADAIFSCLGPALEIFSRYERVETASGKKVELKEYLEHVWATVARESLNMIFAGADASGFEEDSRLTALWLWTLHSSVNNVSAKANNEYLTDEGMEEEETSPKKALKGFYLEYDAARKIAQGLGAHLEGLGGPGGIAEIKGDKARLLSVSERRKALFGKDEKTRPQRRKKSAQATLFEMPEEGQEEVGLPSAGKTVLDRLHQAMLLFADGRSEALRRFIVDEGGGNDDRFWRLSQSLSALYPSHTDEKRWIDGVLARKKSFGF